MSLRRNGEFVYNFFLCTHTSLSIFLKRTNKLEHLFELLPTLTPEGFE